MGAPVATAFMVVGTGVSIYQAVSGSRAMRAQAGAQNFQAWLAQRQNDLSRRGELLAGERAAASRLDQLTRDMAVAQVATAASGISSSSATSLATIGRIEEFGREDLTSIAETSRSRSLSAALGGLAQQRQHEDAASRLRSGARASLLGGLLQAGNLGISAYDRWENRKKP